MVRFQIVLTTAEADALSKLAEINMRDMRDQVRFLLRQELVRSGLLDEKSTSTKQPASYTSSSERR